jgi:single-strand DNA-binding protein
MRAAAVASEVEHRNEVYIVGRLSKPPAERELPSGDVLLQWNVVVERDPAARAGSRVRHDTVECSTLRAGIRRTVSTWSPGDVVQVEGVLRHRYWQGPGGLGSKYEVEALTVKRLRRAPKASAEVE